MQLAPLLSADYYSDIIIQFDNNKVLVLKIIEP